MDAVTISMALAIAVIGVLGTALFALLFMQMQNMREDMTAGFGRLEAQNAQLRRDTLAGFAAQGERIDRGFDVLREHGERLARIESRLNTVESKLDIDPPAEAA